jgi:hypothetical protein
VNDCIPLVWGGGNYAQRGGHQVTAVIDEGTVYSSRRDQAESGHLNLVSNGRKKKRSWCSVAQKRDTAEIELLHSFVCLFTFLVFLNTFFFSFFSYQILRQAH